MKTPLRIPFALLALWAMLLTLLPQTLWACPMTGRLDTASRVCLGVMPTVAGEMPCAGSGSKCCKPVTLPVSGSNDSPAHLAFASLHQADTALAFALPAFDATPLVAATPQTFQSPAVRVFLARFTNSPPPFWTQFRPISLAGRAPPVF